MFKNIILHVPHSSADFSFRGAFESPERIARWRDAAKDLIDWYTDELFVPEYPDATIHPIVFRTCRTLCDVERMSHDPLEEKGCGITYSSLLPLGRGYCVTCNSDIRQLYLDHQYKVASSLIRYNSPLLIDCHSFSSNATPLQPDASGLESIDICIGFNEDFTKPNERIINLVCDYFTELGYRVAVNTPFSNSKTVDTPAHYKSLMIEVNKRVYMYEDDLKKKMPEFLRLKAQLETLYYRLLD